MSRSPSKNHFASYTGTAPIDVSSGNPYRHRLSRAGNRRLNSIRHVAAITQIRYPTPGRVYFERKLAEGKTKKEALRCLRRRISDSVYRYRHRHLRLDATTRAEDTPDKPASWTSLKTRRASYRSTATPASNPPATPEERFE